MEWTITFNEAKQYFKIVTSGIADRDGSLKMAKSISIAMRKIKVKKVLIDHSNIDAVSGEILEIFDRAKEFDEIGMIREIKVAEVVKPKHKQFFIFLETVFVNHGFLFSTFEDKKSALEWLLNP